VIAAKRSGNHTIEIWGDGTQTRSFMFIDDCVLGIRKIHEVRRPCRKCPLSTGLCNPLGYNCGIIHLSSLHEHIHRTPRIPLHNLAQHG
jgi:nucleoside-diphosphate-sugar epimerase